MGQLVSAWGLLMTRGGIAHAPGFAQLQLPPRSISSISFPSSVNYVCSFYFTSPGSCSSLRVPHPLLHFSTILLPHGPKESSAEASIPDAQVRSPHGFLPPLVRPRTGGVDNAEMVGTETLGIIEEVKIAAVPAVRQT